MVVRRMAEQSWANSAQKSGSKADGDMADASAVAIHAL